ncbi:MAG: hypothetical protein J3R72DRAFT_436100 [Linnemannia gamsii]|nr:MAG: hypothetical protein J3R72DRAFT_436100 [Linnemannia gamsii]
MDPLSRLPLECIQHIIHCLLASINPNASACSTLVSLCLVNQHISRIALPFLYRNPFQVLTKLFVNSKRGYRSRVLLRTLFTNNISASNFHPALLLGYGINNSSDTNNNNSIITSPSPALFNHLHLIRHLNLGTFTFLEYDGQNDHKSHPAADYSYIYGQEFLNTYREDRRDAHCLRLQTKNTQLLQYYPNVLYREAVWSLAAPILGQLESLTFPLSDTTRYLQLVDRLPKLEHVVVALDMVFNWNCCKGPAYEPIRIRKDKAVRDVVQFVKDHRRIYPGCLKSLVTICSGFWPKGSSKTCGEDIHEAVSQVLPLHKPEYLSRSNWLWVAAHRQTTDLGGVQKIFQLDPNVVDRQLLQQCRALREIDMYHLVDGCFDWAVQEKRQLRSLGQGLSASSHGVSSTSLSPPAYSTHDLMPLEQIILLSCSMPSQNLHAMVFAFSQSLKYLRINELQGSNLVQTIHVGQGWIELPVLRSLKLYAPRHRLVLDPLLLSQCPSLTEIDAQDETFEYSCQDIVPFLPAQVAKLRFLCLRGWSALAFHPATLEVTKELLALKLSTERAEGYCFIPPVDELIPSYGLGEEGGASHATMSASILRPLWTWDWYLPRLGDLTLTSEFAYRFQFKMLQGCLALERLKLHIRTVEGLHTRVISEVDLFVPGTDGMQDRIVAPRLKRVYMNGRWVIDDPLVLSQFLGTMFPKLDLFIARGWVGVTVRSFVDAVRTAAGHIKYLRTDLVGPSSEEEMVELGMSPRVSSEMKNRNALRTRFNCAGVPFILHKKDLA